MKKLVYIGFVLSLLAGCPKAEKAAEAPSADAGAKDAGAPAADAGKKAADAGAKDAN